MKRRSIAVLLIISILLSFIMVGCKKNVGNDNSSDYGGEGNLTSSNSSDYSFDEEGNLITPDGQIISKDDYTVDEKGNVVTNKGTVIGKADNIASNKDANSTSKKSGSSTTNPGTSNNPVTPSGGTVTPKPAEIKTLSVAKTRPKLNDAYLYPNALGGTLEKNASNVYENKYAKIDATHSTEGYLIVTYFDPWAASIEVLVELAEAGLNEYRYIRTEHYYFNGAEFTTNKPLAINLTMDDALYYVEVISTINGIESEKMSVDLERITAPGALTREYMLPSEEEIQLTQKSPGKYSNKYLEIDTTIVSSGFIIVNYNDTRALQLDVSYTFTANGKMYVGYFTQQISGRATMKVPLVYGQGRYDIRVVSIIAPLWSVKGKLTLNVTSISETGPFLSSNTNVIYNENMQFIKKAAELCKGAKNDFDKVVAIYTWLTQYLSYHDFYHTYWLGAYNCDLEDLYSLKAGVCFDFSICLAAMLRSQNIPCKVILGRYTFSAEDEPGHMWNEVYINSPGSYNSKKISLQGNTWSRLDPTYTWNHPDDGAFIKDSSNYDMEMIT